MKGKADEEESFGGNSSSRGEYGSPRHASTECLRGLAG